MSSINNEFDAAGLAVEIQQLIPKPEHLPLAHLTLKLEHDQLKHDFNKLVMFLNEKGFNYDSGN